MIDALSLTTLLRALLLVAAGVGCIYLAARLLHRLCGWYEYVDCSEAEFNAFVKEHRALAVERSLDTPSTERVEYFQHGELRAGYVVVEGVPQQWFVTREAA